jgi:seryl-tRNA synthetase
MRAARRPFTCLQCRLVSSRTRLFHHTNRVSASNSTPAADPLAPSARPTTAPKPHLDIKHVRQNPTLYEQNCIERNYKLQSTYPQRIVALHQQWQELQHSARSLRERSNLVRKEIVNSATTQGEDEPEVQEMKEESRDQLLEKARDLKQRLSSIEKTEDQVTAEIEELALALPNLTSEDTPIGDEPLVLSYINDHPEPASAESDRVWRSHVHIGSELGLIDFAGAATSSGWGWYYLVDEGARLEQALVDFALKTATRHGWRQVAPPSVVYGHVAAACGFQPRDQNGETQIYAIAQSEADRERGKPELVLAGTAEIPLAGMKADTILEEADMPMKRVGVSRCYRAEAGARGVDTKGLYRVHEFTKVEMFAWAEPNLSCATEVFDEMVDIQTEILQMLGLHCRVLEMPTGDLGASASRKCDIEAFFPSRIQKNDGWGEVTSASICTDYQTRRLATRMKTEGKLTFPWTANGTALAVPRVLAAILENGWDEDDSSVRLPECLWESMGMEKIVMKHRHK